MSGATPSVPDTVTEALALLAAEGYTEDFFLRSASIRCASCSTAHSAEAAVVDRVFRFEGASDPDDEAIVFGMRCPACGIKGTMVSGYGPSADPGDLETLTLLRHHID